MPALTPSEGGLQFLVPTGRTSAVARTARYLAIFGFFSPPLAPVALVLGILGVRDLSEQENLAGSVGRAPLVQG